MKYPVKQSHLLQISLLVLAGCLAVMVIVKTVQVFDTSAVVAEPVVAEGEDSKNSDKSEDKGSKTRYHEQADALKKTNPFLAPASKPGPPNMVSGILGDQALINGKWYSQGDKIGSDGEIVNIDAYEVTLKWDGKEIYLRPLDGANGDSSRSQKIDPTKLGSSSGPVATVIEDRSKVQDELGWLQGVPRQLKNRFRGVWGNMNDQQRQMARERWEAMSEDERAAIVDRFAREQ